MKIAFLIPLMGYVFVSLLSPVVALLSYQNPVLDMDFPDPTVIRGHDKLFYAYATMGNGHRLQMASSNNLVNWTYHGEALNVSSGSFAWIGTNTWAPDVSFHNDQYFMYFGATGPTGTMCIAVGTSLNPLGPFTDALGKPLYCDSAFHAIDPKSFDDPVSGKIYLYWGSDFIPLKVRELDSSRLAFTPGSTPSSVVNTSTNPYESLVEGSWVYYNSTTKTYYIMYSGDNCCGNTAHYAVMVAQASSPTGPFTKLGIATGNNQSMILQINSSDTSIDAPGHNSVVVDDNGTPWIFYHAYVGSGRNARRLMMDKVTYTTIPSKNTAFLYWPYVGYPSASVMPGPYIASEERL